MVKQIVVDNIQSQVVTVINNFAHLDVQRENVFSDLRNILIQSGKFTLDKPMPTAKDQVKLILKAGEVAWLEASLEIALKGISKKDKVKIEEITSNFKAIADSPKAKKGDWKMTALPASYNSAKSVLGTALERGVDINQGKSAIEGQSKALKPVIGGKVETPKASTKPVQAAPIITKESKSEDKIEAIKVMAKAFQSLLSSLETIEERATAKVLIEEITLSIKVPSAAILAIKQEMKKAA
jgi:hypothetical protein